MRSILRFPKPNRREYLCDRRNGRLPSVRIAALIGTKNVHCSKPSVRIRYDLPIDTARRADRPADIEWADPTLPIRGKRQATASERPLLQSSAP